MSAFLRTFVLLGLIVAVALSARADDLKVDIVVTKDYPTLVPIIVLRVALQQAVGSDPAHWKAIGWTPTATTSYVVLNSTTGHQIPIRSVEFPKIVTTGKPNYTIAYLTLENNPHDNDQMTVSIIGSAGTIAQTVKAVAAKGFQPYSLNFNPQGVPSETLSNGKKRDVGQLAVSFTYPEIIPSWRYARTYLESTDLFSTDGKDAKSAFEVTTGIERSLLGSWYVPAHIESKFQGNQTAQNFSYLFGGGMQTIIPWGHMRPGLYNSALQIPLSPVIGVNLQYEHRIIQDAQSIKKFPNTNSLQLNPTLSWKPIRLLPGLLGQDTADIETNLQGWYLPFDQTKSVGGRSRFEAAGDVSLLIPLSKLDFLPGTRFLTTVDPAHARVRIKYAAGANPANGFLHSRQTSFGIEVIK